MNFVPSIDPFALLGAADYRILGDNIRAVHGLSAIIWGFDFKSDLPRLPLASPAELSEFLKSVEKRAFKRTTYHVRNDESALDIVQDSMMKLAEHYGHKPIEELPMLFQRILSNTTLDWFRRQKVKNALFSSFSDFHSGEDDNEFDILDSVSTADVAAGFDNPETESQRTQTFKLIEQALLLLPNRQREAFLMRYWEDMDVSETASAMGCSEGSVKTHCSRAVQALSKALSSKAVK